MKFRRSHTSTVQIKIRQIENNGICPILDLKGISAYKQHKQNPSGLKIWLCI